VSGLADAAARGVFWTSLFLVLYAYLLYPLVLFVAYSFEQLRRDLRYLAGRGDRRPRAMPTAALPPISLIVPAYNEAASLPTTLENLRRLDYPTDKLEVVIVSDGSTDLTNAILQAADDPWIQAVLLPTRGGKPNAVNAGIARARHDLLVLSDASTLFAPDALLRLVRHFADPAVGVVCGALDFQGNDGYRQTEGVYWRYEGMLRLMEARLGATLTASGAIYALRRAAYVPLPPDALIEDFLVPMNARRLGYRVLYDPESRAVDTPASSVEGEFTRRVRLAAGSFRALGTLFRIPFHFYTLLAFLSHKVLRWVLPFLLIALLLSSALLWRNPLYRLVCMAQIAFYLWAAAGRVFGAQLRRIRFGLLPYYLTAIHLAFLFGFVRSLRGRQTVTWQRVS
jgi:cellulose synthase/poly-beta-1,6-N-acetylglucosamine synthase-like glycosyltransferase